MSDREGVRERIARGAQDAYDTLKVTTYDAMPRESKARWLRVADYVLSLGATAAPRTDALRALVQWIGENTLLETHEGEAIFLHSEDCPSFCDHACNEPAGSKKAEEFNALLSAVAAPAAPGASPPEEPMLGTVAWLESIGDRSPLTVELIETRRIVENAFGEGQHFPLSRRKVLELLDSLIALREWVHSQAAGAPGAVDAIEAGVRAALDLASEEVYGPDREVMDLLRATHASLDEVHSALFDRCGDVPPATMDERHILDRGMAVLARLARALGR